MHIVENISKQGKKIYQSILLRESYRENGKVKKRTIANLSNCKPEEIAAIKLALKHKKDLSELAALQDDVVLQEGLSVGAVWALYQTAVKLGIEKVLGTTHEGKVALWQVIARIIDQGSRLSHAQTHAVSDILQVSKEFNEDNLYSNLAWMADRQTIIEDNLLSIRRADQKPELFLYDVTSSYLEGEKNFFGSYGYNRDGKKGKKQIVVGLLCDEFGDPVSTEVFFGNTNDAKTFCSQVQKAVRRFGCERVTFVGDRGMIKSGQIEELPENFFYITAITKAQISTLIKDGKIQLELFDKDLCEIEEGESRYILKRNPVRSEEMEDSRVSKQKSVEGLAARKNQYLSEHPRAKTETAIKLIQKRIEKLKIDKWLHVEALERSLNLKVDKEALDQESCLDGCYIIKTNMPKEAASKDVIHDRYKDLSMVEQAFRNCKTTYLELRPVYVRTEKSTRGHVLTIMLSYLILRHLQKKWKDFDITVEEGISQLSTLCSMEVKVKDKTIGVKIPKPRERSKQLLDALNIQLPEVIRHRGVKTQEKNNSDK